MKFLLSLAICCLGALAVAPANADTSKAATAHVNAVLRAAAGMVAARDSESWDAFDGAFNPVLTIRNPDTDSALAALVPFYIGEHADEDLTCELLARGRSILPLLRTYRDHPFQTSEPARLLDEAERKERYDSLIKRIEAGEACRREP